MTLYDLALLSLGASCETTPLTVASSAVLSRRWLVAFRLSAAALVFILTVRRMLTPISHTKQTLDIQPVPSCGSLHGESIPCRALQRTI